MTSSSSSSAERGLDTMILVYSLLQGHPAAASCQQFLRAHTGWFTSTLVLFEAKAILTKVYGVDAALATQKLAQLAAMPVLLLEVDAASSVSAFGLADRHGIDLTDAILLHLVQQRRSTYLATDDQNLGRVCTQLGIMPQTPLNPALRQQIAAWETTQLAPRGLARVLRRCYQWLNQIHPQAAQDFWSHTGAGSHLP